MSFALPRDFAAPDALVMGLARGDAPGWYPLVDTSIPAVGRHRRPIGPTVARPIRSTLWKNRSITRSFLSSEDFRMSACSPTGAARLDGTGR